MLSDAPRASLGRRLWRKLWPSRRLPEVHRDLLRVRSDLACLERRIERMQQALGRIEARQTETLPEPDLARREFRVWSQWGEDGILAHLCSVVPVERDTFVEFGVESYQEANTRFLLFERNWRGLVIDPDAQNVARIRSSREHWLHDLTAVQAFVTAENVDRLIGEAGFRGPLGVLSIDVDGMDYWIWKALTVVQPAIVAIEYNWRFGPQLAVTVPYVADFDRRRAHPSLLYYGASLRALCELGGAKGYAFVGCGAAGVNAFFVRRDLLPESVPELDCARGYVEGRFCEAHDGAGRRVKMSAEEQRGLVLGLPLVDVSHGNGAP